MFVVTVTFIVRPEAWEAFLPLMQANAHASVETEPGCSRFDICTSPEDPDEVFLYEVYDTEAAFAAHQTMPHYLTFNDATSEMIRAKSIKTYALVP